MAISWDRDRSRSKTYEYAWKLRIRHRKMPLRFLGASRLSRFATNTIQEPARPSARPLIQAARGPPGRGHGQGPGLMDLGSPRQDPRLTNFIVAETYALLLARLDAAIARRWPTD